jgi:hypothetical protein
MGGKTSFPRNAMGGFYQVSEQMGALRLAVAATTLLAPREQIFQPNKHRARKERLREMKLEQIQAAQAAHLASATA